MTLSVWTRPNLKETRFYTAQADAERRAREHWQAKAEAMSALLEAAVNGSADGQREYKHHSEVTAPHLSGLLEEFSTIRYNTVRNVFISA